ncbi:MAG: hypothetical protein V4674_04025 [Patescibacteria group bacterium]
MTEYKRPLLAVTVVLVLALVGFFAYKDLDTTPLGENIHVPVSGVQDYIVDGKKVGTIEVVPSGEGSLPQPIPDLTKTPKVLIKDTSMTAEAWKIVTDKVRSLQVSLTRDPSNIEEWVTLGTFRKTLGDYPGTIAAWEYASKLSPSFVVPYGNLADLYAYTLRDNIKAEASFKAAIAADPKAGYIYFQAYDFYKNVLKDMTKARAVADLGLKNNPGDKELAALAKQ